MAAETASTRSAMMLPACRSVPSFASIPPPQVLSSHRRWPACPTAASPSYGRIRAGRMAAATGFICSAIRLTERLSAANSASTPIRPVNRTSLRWPPMAAASSSPGRPMDLTVVAWVCRLSVSAMRARPLVPSSVSMRAPPAINTNRTLRRRLMAASSSCGARTVRMAAARVSMRSASMQTAPQPEPSSASIPTPQTASMRRRSWRWQVVASWWCGVRTVRTAAAPVSMPRSTLATARRSAVSFASMNPPWVASISPTSPRLAVAASPSPGAMTTTT